MPGSIDELEDKTDRSMRKLLDFTLPVGALIEPVFPLSVDLSAVDRGVLVIVAMLVATAASYGAIRRTLRIDPAQAFAGPGA